MEGEGNLQNLKGEEIYTLLPQRYPYMILDELHVEAGKMAEAHIYLKAEDWFFKCHFPGKPIFPGFLLVEAMGQVLLSTFISPAALIDHQIPLMTEVKNISFRDFCIPGDRVIIQAELIRFKYGTARGTVVAYKNDVTQESIVTEVKMGFVLPQVLSKK